MQPRGWVSNSLTTMLQSNFFYGISNILGYLMPNQFYRYKQFYFKQYSIA